MVNVTTPPTGHQMIALQHKRLVGMAIAGQTVVAYLDAAGMAAKCDGHADNAVDAQDCLTCRIRTTGGSKRFSSRSRSGSLMPRSMTNRGLVRDPTPLEPGLIG